MITVFGIFIPSRVVISLSRFILGPRWFPFLFTSFLSVKNFRNPPETANYPPGAAVIALDSTSNCLHYPAVRLLFLEA